MSEVHSSSEPQLAAAGPSAQDRIVTSLPERYAQISQVLQSTLPPTCRWLNMQDMKIIGVHPIAAGSFADIWEATHDGRRVVLKSYRCYVTLDVAQVTERFLSEVRVCGLLRGRVKVASFVGIYSTETHPLGVVYEYMYGLDLSQYLRNEPNVARLKLLTRVAQDLSRMHSIDAVHGSLKATNVLVDENGTPCIAGLGNMFIPDDSIARIMEDNATIDRLQSRDLAVLGLSSSITDPSLPTKAGDMYALGVLAFEVFTGHPPFFKMTEMAAKFLMLKGDRPPRPGIPEITDTLWHIIERCWHAVSSERMSIEEAVNLLEAELRLSPNT